MAVGGSTVVIEELVQIYPQEVVLEQLEWLYREEIRRTIREIDALLPSYRAQVDEASYLRDREGFMALVAWSCDSSLSVHELETLLKCLLWQARLVAGSEEPFQQGEFAAWSW